MFSGLCWCARGAFHSAPFVRFHSIQFWASRQLTGKFPSLVFCVSIQLMVTLEEIENLAALARIELGDEEKEKLQKDVGAILEYISQIKEAAAESAEGVSNGAPVNVMREDTNPHESGVYTDVLLSAAPQREGDYIRVKKIL